jgi:hypothetical protein
VPAKAKKKKISVSIKEPTSEDAAGAFHQACWRRTSNTLISHNSYIQPKGSNKPQKVQNQSRLQRFFLRYEANHFTTTTIRPAPVCGYSSRKRLEFTVNILTSLAY